MESEGTRRSPLLPPRLMAGLTLAAALAVGVAVGVTLDRVALHHHGHRHWFDRTPSESERRKHAARMAKELSLTPVQAAAFDSILAGRTRQLEMGRTRFETEMRALMADTRRQIDSLLTPEQREKLEALRLRHGHKRPGT